jgi:predicted nucleotidyltransferase
MNATFENIGRCRNYSNDMLEQIRVDLAEILPTETFLVGTNGSFARREASSQSDLDFIIVCDNEKDVGAVKEKRRRGQRKNESRDA